MKRIFTVLLTLVFTLSITAMPVFAKGGGGGKGGGGKSSSSIGSSVKGDNGVKNDKSDSVFKNTINSNKEKNSSTVKAIGIKAVGGKGSTAEYSDTSGHWASKSINTLKALGIINGYQDGSFRPDNPVSSTEAVVLMVKLAETLDTDEETTEENPGEEIASEETEDEDSSDEESSEETVSEQAPNWAKESFKQAGTRGIINLNRFHSQVQASRVECAVMLAKALATGDMLCGGRLTVGIGVGGRHEDYRAVGADPKTQTMREMAERVAELMELRLRVKGEGLPAKLKHGGRLLPRKVLGAAQYLAQAAEQARMPKLQGQIDAEKIALAYDLCVRHLKPLGSGARRGAILWGLAGSLAAILVLCAGLFAAALVWRGYL